MFVAIATAAAFAGPVILLVRYFRWRNAFTRAKRAYVEAAGAKLTFLERRKLPFQAFAFARRQAAPLFADLRQDFAWSIGMSVFFLMVGGVTMAPIGMLCGVAASLLITLDNWRRKAPDARLVAEARAERRRGKP